jgi:hypothetical protein
MMPPVARLCAAVAAPGALLASHSPARAHAIAERYDLPVPLGFYVAGAAAVVVVTFLITAAFVYAAPVEKHTGDVTSLRIPAPLQSAATVLLQVVGVIALLAIVATGLFGNPHPARNLSPTLVWVIWWCGFSLFVACVADLWPLLNPWRTLFQLGEWLGGQRLARPYPEKAAEWPAVAFLLVFVWIELVSPFASSPIALAVLTLLYTTVTFAGMAAFGREAWLERGEVFSIVFRILGSFAPVGHAERGSQANPAEPTAHPGCAKAGTLLLRPWSAGLLMNQSMPSTAIVALVLLLLTAVLFDGLLGTALWRSIEPWLPSHMDGMVASSIGLFVTWAVFLGAYLITAAAMAWILEGEALTAAVARRYVLTLVPIAIGYNIAHNYSYILIQSQAFVALLSDPFGAGWNLFGTAGLQPDLTVVDARTIWYVAVGSIVVGHIIAVFLAHVVALRTSPSRRSAIRSLYPMTILMVLYTGVSLSILAEPIVRFSMPDPSYS